VEQSENDTTSQGTGVLGRPAGGAATINPYEEQRKQNIQRNKEALQKFNLDNLKLFSVPSAPRKKNRERDRPASDTPVAPRRSSRRKLSEAKYNEQSQSSTSSESSEEVITEEPSGVNPAWWNTGAEVGDIVLVAAEKGDFWLGEILELLQVVWDEQKPHKYKGDIVVREYARVHMESENTPAFQAYLPSWKKKLQFRHSKARPGSKWEPVKTTIWWDCVQGWGSKVRMLQENHQLTSEAVQMLSVD
jgi:hypothetical protein